MAWKNLKQQSLADALIIEHAAIKELDSLNEMINWPRLEKLLKGIHAKDKGEKAWPPLMMFKGLLLQSWYGLSDPGLERQLARDLLFRRFIGLDLSETVPDHSTFWRFRQKLEDQQLIEQLFSAVNEQLREQGLYIKQGEVSIVDASVIEAKQSRPNKNKQGESTQDPEAAWNVKNGSDGKRKSTYGYKTHMNIDEDGFIKNVDLTAGNVHDSKCFTTLLSGHESAVYADSAYASEDHDKWLSKRGINNRILKRAYRNRPLTKTDRCFNRMHAGMRSTVERVFGILKQHYGMAKARYMGKVRNRMRVMLMSIAYNLKRGCSIQQACCA